MQVVTKNDSKINELKLFSQIMKTHLICFYQIRVEVERIYAAITVVAPHLKTCETTREAFCFSTAFAYKYQQRTGYMKYIRLQN